MMYARNPEGELHHFTLDAGEMVDVEQVSTFDKVKAIKMTALQEANLKLKGAVLATVKGGKL